MTAVVYQDVRVRYGEHRDPVLDGLSLSVQEGERVALLGLNGSGKTTLLMATVGLVPFEGEIAVCGTPLARRSLATIRANIGFLFNVPEDQLLLPRVLDDVAFGLVQRGIPTVDALARARETLAALEIEQLAEAAPHELSHGQKQRVALAGAIVTRPPLLLLDEPSAGLDPPAKWLLADYLRKLPSAMIVATHDLAFARRLCTRYVLLERARVACEGASFDDVNHQWNEPAR